MPPCRSASVAGAVVVVCHGQVCGGVGDSQPPEKGLVCNHPRLILRLRGPVAGVSSSIILFLLSVAVTLVVTVVVAMVVAVVVVVVVAVFVAVAVTTVIALAPPLLLGLCISPSPPVLLWRLVIALSPLCHIKTFIFIPIRNDCS